MIHVYSFNKDKLIVISDKDKDKITKKYGHKYEIINSFKDKQSILYYRLKLERQSPTFGVVEDYYVKKYHSEETKQRMAKSHTGLKHSDEVKRKMSRSHAGKSNHTGKKHSKYTKDRISQKMSSKKQVLGKKIIYNPAIDKERRVADIINLPDGFRKGRDPEVINTMHYGRDLKLLRSSNSK